MWPRLVNIAIGIWLTASPAVLDFRGLAANNVHIAGPLIAAFACIAIWEATRPVRWVNLPLGLWLIASPLIVEHSVPATVNIVIAGGIVALNACLGGKIKQRFAGGWSSLLR
jgi:hypothetical protein